MTELLFSHISLLLALVVSITGAGFALRWAVRNVPTDSSPRRLVQTFTMAGGIGGLVPGLVVGTLGGGDIGGAFMAIPFQFWLRLPPELAWSIGMMLFMTSAVVLLALLGAVVGYSAGHYVGAGIECARRAVRSR